MINLEKEKVAQIAAKLPSPCYFVFEELLEKNLRLLAKLQQDTGCKVLLAQKAFSMFYFYPLIDSYLSGMTASGLYEARLAHEYMKKGENHIFSPAYQEKDFDQIAAICQHVVFNSFNQWHKFKERALAAKCQCGLRINPECSTQEHSIYDPCAVGSRLGIRAKDFIGQDLCGISGLHFHTLCEQDADALSATLKAVEEKFAPYLRQIKWLNLGGGHHITRQGYDFAKLENLIIGLKDRYNIEVYIEPGEAVALNTGFLVAIVIDIVENGRKIAILDASAACHMPDVIEMPYRPPLLGSGEPDEKKYTYILGGPTCLAGDVIGTYSFDQPLKVGDKLIFGDMAIYSMVKNNTFNGMPLPAIAAIKNDETIEIVKKFGYEDFKMRLS